ncbi:MAG: hypothetical protein JO004_10895 [Methylobacteriaceae bacterium]|nr:hypothetical protein [Methylobacteriaceae bacterium]
MTTQATSDEKLAARVDRLEGELAALTQFNLQLCRMLRYAAATGEGAPSGETLLKIAHAAEMAACRLDIPGQGIGQHNGFEHVAYLLNRARLDVPLPVDSGMPRREVQYRFKDGAASS